MKLSNPKAFLAEQEKFVPQAINLVKNFLIPELCFVPPAHRKNPAKPGDSNYHPKWALIEDQELKYHGLEPEALWDSDDDDDPPTLTDDLTTILHFLSLTKASNQIHLLAFNLNYTDMDEESRIWSFAFKTTPGEYTKEDLLMIIQDVLQEWAMGNMNFYSASQSNDLVLITASTLI